MERDEIVDWFVKVWTKLYATKPELMDISIFLKEYVRCEKLLTENRRPDTFD